jgi:hypothetical protein
MQAPMDRAQRVHHRGGRAHVLRDSQRRLDLSQNPLGLILRGGWAGSHVPKVQNAPGITGSR